MKKIALLFFITALSAQPLDTLRIKTEADSLFTVANSLQKSWQLDDALELHQNALAKYQQISDRENEAKTLWSGIGLVYYHQSEYKKSIMTLEKALSIYVEFGDRELEGSTSNIIGLAFLRLSLYTKALECFEESLKIAREFEDRNGEGNALNNLGIVKSRLSDSLKALEYYKKALDIYRELGDHKYVGITLGNIGSAYDNLSNYPKSLAYFEESLKIARKFGNQISEAHSLINIGKVYSNLYNYSKSLEYFENSLKIIRKIGDRQAEGNILSNIGAVRIDSNHQKALEYFEESLKIAKELGDRLGEGGVLSNIGTVYEILSDYPKAIEYFEECLGIYRAIGDLKQEDSSLRNIGLIKIKQGKYAEAEEYIIKALAIAQETKVKDNFRISYSALGDCYVAQNLDSLAVENYVLSIEAAENIRGKLEVEGQKTSYSAGISGIYAKIILSLLKLERYDDAFNYSERSRARSFLDLLASGEVKVGKSRHEEFLKKEEESQDKEEEIEEQLIAAEEDTVLYASFRGKLEEHRGFIAVEMEEKKEYEPELASLVTVNSLTLSEVQALLNKETVLEYFLTDEKTLIWLITKEDAEVFQVDIGGDSLKTLVENFRSAIANLSKEDKPSSELYNLLIAPAGKKIYTEQLVIIPHGILHYLPFQALQDEKGKYLLDKYQISYLPSASVMKYIIPKKRKKGKKVLALGNPKLDNPEYGSIPFAEKEVKEISKQYRKSKIFIGEDATEENFRELAPDYDILHLACHAELNSAYPLYSGLLLSSSEEQDGDLDVHELFTMDLNAYLVVLSACQTGLGHLTNGDELVGLSRAFIYAGTPSIISSLWMVEDESTAFLMEQLYKNLKRYDKAKSLRKAQLETKKKFKNLRSWASFVLIGDSE